MYSTMNINMVYIHDVSALNTVEDWRVGFSVEISTIESMKEQIQRTRDA